MAEGDRHPTHFPTIRRIGRLILWIKRPRNLLVLGLILILLWVFVPYLLGLWSLHQMRAAPRPRVWTARVSMSAGFSPVLRWHMRHRIISGLEHRRASLEFLILYHLADERRSELLAEVREALLSAIASDQSDEWRVAMAREVGAWVESLHSIDPATASDVAREALSNLPISPHVVAYVQSHVLPSVQIRGPTEVLTLGPKSDPLAIYGNRATAVLFHPTAETLIVGSRSGVHGFDLRTLENELIISCDEVLRLAMSPGGSVLAVQRSRSDAINLYDWATRDQIAVWSIESGRPDAMHFLSGTELLAYWRYATPNMRVWDVGREEETRAFNIPETPRTNLIFEFDRSHIAVRTDYSRSLDVYGADTGEKLFSTALSRVPFAFAFAEDATRVLLCGYGNQESVLSEWDLASGSVSRVATVEVIAGPAMFDIQVSGRVGVVRGGTGVFIINQAIWEVEQMLVFPHANERVFSLSPDQSRLAIGSRTTNEVALFDLATLDPEVGSP